MTLKDEGYSVSIPQGFILRYRQPSFLKIQSDILMASGVLQKKWNVRITLIQFKMQWFL